MQGSCPIFQLSGLLRRSRASSLHDGHVLISTAAASKLRALEVHVRTAALKVWAAGIQAAGSFGESGLQLNRGQILVGPAWLYEGLSDRP